MTRQRDEASTHTQTEQSHSYPGAEARRKRTQPFVVPNTDGRTISIGPKLMPSALALGFEQIWDRTMADDKSKRGGRDRATVSAEEPYEVGYFARKHGISRDQAQKLIDKIGGNRAKLNAAAEKLKAK
jgi:hypothetical protein